MSIDRIICVPEFKSYPPQRHGNGGHRGTTIGHKLKDLTTCGVLDRDGCLYEAGKAGRAERGTCQQCTLPECNFTYVRELRLQKRLDKLCSVK